MVAGFVSSFIPNNIKVCKLIVPALLVGSTGLDLYRKIKRLEEMKGRQN